MRKYRGILLSVSVAAMLFGSSMAVLAEETEAATEAAVVEEAAEAVETVAEEVGENGLIASDVANLESMAGQLIQTVTQLDDAQIEDILNPESIFTIYPDNIVEAVTSWKGIKDELGAFEGVEGCTIDTKDGIVIVAHSKFANDVNDVTITLSDDTIELESISFAVANQTMGAKMKEAVLNTLMGVCIVFLMLLFLSLLISQFKHVNKLENMFNKKSAPAPAPVKAAAPAPAPVVEEEVVDDGELIAVIAAAIAAAEGTSTDGFVVRSIKKSNRNKWQRA